VADDLENPEAFVHPAELDLDISDLEDRSDLADGSDLADDSDLADGSDLEDGDDGAK